MYKLLIIDDEEAICASLEFAFEDEYRVYTAVDEIKALALIEKEEFDIILLDLKLGKSNGIDLLTKIKARAPHTAVIIMTAYGSIESSVEAMRKGAFYYVTKPINIDALKALFSKAVEYLKLKSKIEYLNEKLVEEYELSGIIGCSEAIRHVFGIINKVKDIDTNVMITGESGTGKELVARAIHFKGNRKNEPFEVINCAAITPSLLESELFGYEKGAFTGAIHDKKGIFEVADNGTIFLDEISEMDLNLQAKLLRAVQEKEIIPVGSTKPKKVNARIICATNRDAQKEVEEGRFREDLLFRLNVINIHIPPLRERKEDIPLLVKHFISKYSKKTGKVIGDMTKDAMDILCNYNFKGNVRELQNIIERAIVLTDKTILDTDDLPSEVIIGSRNHNTEFNCLIPIFVGDDMETIERKVILYTLKFLKGNRNETARLLKISERNLRYKLKEYKEKEGIYI